MKGQAQLPDAAFLWLIKDQLPGYVDVERDAIIALVAAPLEEQHILVMLEAQALTTDLTIERDHGVEPNQGI